ncbi:MAG: hypothetical protein BGO43_12020 [Gammaproteobacteria bacterium 39-13]|nr:MAG: hypothetical protein BGO43_12020 [Gammaproteobacteria bacterium 39-13]
MAKAEDVHRDLIFSSLYTVLFEKIAQTMPHLQRKIGQTFAFIFAIALLITDYSFAYPAHQKLMQLLFSVYFVSG